MLIGLVSDRCEKWIIFQIPAHRCLTDYHREWEKWYYRCFETTHGEAYRVCRYYKRPFDLMNRQIMIRIRMNICLVSSSEGAKIRPFFRLELNVS